MTVCLMHARSRGRVRARKSPGLDLFSLEPRCLLASTPVFLPAISRAVGSGPESVLIGNLNGAGLADLASANAGGNSVSLVANQGGGAFAAAVNSATGTFPTAIVAADLDGD